MDGKEVINGFRVTMNGDEVPASYHIAPRIITNSQPCESPAPVPVPVPVTAIVTTTVTPTGVAVTSSEVKKKRGRPRKYSPDGTLAKPAKPLSPMPISASIPLSGDFSGWKHGRGKPMDSFKKKHKLEFENSGDQMAYSVGANFTPHVLTVNAGEDIMMKIISFSQQGSQAICILAANGAISNVTLRQPNSSGGTLTYEGRFEILTLSGSFMLTDNTVTKTKSRTGGMSVSLAGPDGRVLGGGLAGLLVAAGPVQVVVGTFLPGHQQEHQKQKKPRFEHAATFAPTPITGEGTEAPVYSGLKPMIVTHSSPLNSVQGLKNLVPESSNNISFTGVVEEAINLNPIATANGEVSC